VFQAGEKLTAARSATSKRSRTKRARTRRRAAALRLPAVTPHGIPRLHVKAAYVVDANTNRVLFQKNPERVLPIASLTKLVTAMVFLRTNPDWDRVIEVIPEDVKYSSRSHIRAREEITVRDLIHASLMSSDNVATKALVRTSGMPREDFVRRMNLMADSLGLGGTHFVEPTGLSELNVATAQDCARILRAATESEVVSAITQKPEYTFTSNRKVHRLINTNRLLRSQWTVTGGKTGFIREAGYCLVTNVKGPSGSDVTAVVLGAPSNALRFAEARRILDWTFRFGLSLPGARPEND
jgi:D-alanyl-D-alanine endopeptidase (penicillin-binding protein 7)